MHLSEFNQLPDSETESELFRCCGSKRWARQLTLTRPFENINQLFEAADRIWNSLSSENWLEAFGHHPRIGDVNELRKKFASTSSWAAEEQAGTSNATEEVLSSLSLGNKEYEDKFGFVFLVCATGKSAGEILSLLKARLQNQVDDELKIAADEQSKITKIRLEKLIQ